MAAPAALTVILPDKTIVNRSVREERWGHEGMWTWLTLVSRVLRQRISFWRSPVWVTSSVQRAWASFLGSHVRTTCQTKASQTSRHKMWDTIALSVYYHFSWKHLKWREGLKDNCTHLFKTVVMDNFRHLEVTLRDDAHFNWWNHMAQIRDTQIWLARSTFMQSLARTLITHTWAC